MSTALEIERAIEQLPAKELTRLRDWFAEFDAKRWDEQLEADVAAGKLDALAEEALREAREGKLTDL